MGIVAAAVRAGGDNWIDAISDEFLRDCTMTNCQDETHDAKDARLMYTLSERYPAEHRRFWQANIL